MAAPIQDEFSRLRGKVSRQRIYMLRKERDGICHQCTELAIDQSLYCAEHKLARREYFRSRKMLQRTR